LPNDWLDFPIPVCIQSLKINHINENLIAAGTLYYQVTLSPHFHSPQLQLFDVRVQDRRPVVHYESATHQHPINAITWDQQRINTISESQVSLFTITSLI
jgi:hypothetical protein